MARRGENPGRNLTTSYKPARVTVAVLTYVPSPDGYFKYRFEMIKLVLAALQANTHTEYDLLVFDNGSYPELVEYLIGLKQKGVIDYLYLSRHNIGNFGALRMIFNSAPGEVIAYLDDDVFVYPGWLDEQLKILDSYPNVGMVSGVPVRNASKRNNESLARWLEEPPPGLSVSHDRFIPDGWEYDWAVSTSRDPESYLDGTKDIDDILLEYRGVQAMKAANHFQFVGFKEVLQKGVPENWDQRMQGNMAEFDRELDQLGYLRLSTTGRFARHIGNTINEELRQEAQALGLDDVDAVDMPLSKQNWILYFPPSRRILTAIYHRLFRMLYLHK